MNTTKDQTAQHEMQPHQPPSHATTAVTVYEEVSAAKPIKWEGAADLAIAAKRERDRIIKSVLVEGVDYGTPYPGATKKVLLKPGAEKICDSLNIYPDYEIIDQKERWDRNDPFFAYTVKCVLRQRGTDLVVGSGIGSCNSFEDKYYWRNAERVCPTCNKNTVSKGRKEFGGGWFCSTKKGGCGAKWPNGAKEIEGQEIGKQRNEAIFDQVNTLLKMAQKRAHIAATLNVGSFSEKFTSGVDQDDAEVNNIELEKLAKQVATHKNRKNLTTPREIEGILDFLSDPGKQTITSAKRWIAYLNKLTKPIAGGQGTVKVNNGQGTAQQKTSSPSSPAERDDFIANWASANEADFLKLFSALKEGINFSVKGFCMKHDITRKNGTFPTTIKELLAVSREDAATALWEMNVLAEKGNGNGK